jgi:hypothetical protein
MREAKKRYGAKYLSTTYKPATAKQAARAATAPAQPAKKAVSDNTHVVGRQSTQT